MSDDKKRFTGRDVAEALSAARRHFQRSRKELGFEIVEQPKVGPLDEVPADLVAIEAWPLTDVPSGDVPPEPGSRDDRPHREHRGDRGDRHGGRRDRFDRDRDRGPRRDARADDEPIELPVIVPGEDVSDPEAVLRHVVTTMIAGLDLELDISAVEHSDAGWRVSMDGADAHLLSEEKGEGLDAFQYLVNRFLLKDPRGIGRVLVDAGGHRARHEERLVEKAKALADEVRESGSKREMAPLGPFERRIVHLALAEVEGIRTYSSGQGYRRRVNIAPAAGDDDE